MDAMNTTPAQRAARTYNAAADHFDDAPLAFWDRHGRRAVELAALHPGSRVLDVGCGTGASALPAAEATGPNGQVVGLDVAELMLGRARHKAGILGLSNIDFRCADMSNTGEPDESFDAVIGVFSIFFVPDMERQVAELWRLVRPGGRLVLTVWGERSFAPGADIFTEEMRRLRPTMTAAPRPWERLVKPAGLRRLFVSGGASAPQIHAAPDRQTLHSPEDWWTICIGSGFRGDIDQLSAGEKETLKARMHEHFVHQDIQYVEMNALHAVAQK